MSNKRTNKVKSTESNKKNKNSFETCFKPTWHEIKSSSYLELIISAKRAKWST